MTQKLALLLFILFSFGLYAQETIFIPPDGNNSRTTDGSTIGIESSFVPTQRQIELQKQVAELKRQDTPESKEKMLRLLDELNSTLPNVVTSSYVPYDGKIEYVPDIPIEGDVFPINATRLFTSSLNIRGIATATQTRGANAGRIWVFVEYYSGNTTSPDTAKLLYSTNNGLSWILQATLTLGGTDKFRTDDVDMEIIEPTSGDSYIWIVYGLTASGGSGKVFSGGAVIRTPTFAGSAFAFSWPGNDPAKKYYFPRITTDNAQYSNFAYIYVAISFDSTNNQNSQKYLYCSNPYTTTPTFTYKADRVLWYCGAMHPKELHTDIAYFDNSGDSVIFVFSNVPDSTKLFYSKMAAFGTLEGSSAGSNIGGSEATDRKSLARLSTNENSNGCIITFFKQYTGGVWRAKYFRTTNFSYLGSFAQSTLFGSVTSNIQRLDSRGVRNSNTYYLAMIQWGSIVDSLRYLNVNGMTGGWPTNIYKMNPDGFLLSGIISPRPGFRNVANDSCFAIYSQFSASNVWASYGCSGEVSNINNLTIPAEYELHQNYPNPFNPITAIKFSIPKTQYVKLSVYDVLGKEVSVLVNGVMQAGSYIVDFNASDLPSGLYFYKLTAGEYISVKKMILVK